MADQVVTRWPLARAADIFVPAHVRSAFTVARTFHTQWHRPRDEHDTDERLRYGRRQADEGLQNAHLSIWRSLVGLADEGRVVVYGAKGDVFGEQIEIRPDQLASAADFDLAGSRIAFLSGNALVWFCGVQLVPALADRSIATRLGGSLNDILGLYVLNDPEILSLWGAPTLAAQLDAIPAGDTGSCVPLTASRSQIQQRLESLFSRDDVVAEGREPGALEALADRLATLFDLMMTGKIQLAGRSAADADIEPVPLSFWRRPDLAFCLGSATILQGDSLALVDAGILNTETPSAGASPKASHRNVDVDRFAAIDAVLAKALETRDKIFPTANAFAEAVAQEARSRGNIIGNGEDRRDQAVRPSRELTPQQVKAMDGWLLQNFKKTRAIFAKQ